MASPYDGGSTGSAYAATGIGSGLQGLLEGVKLAHEMKNQDLQRQLGFQRMNELSDYRGGMLGIKERMADILKQKADAYEARSPSAKADPIQKELDSAIKSGAYIGKQVPIAINLAHKMGRLPTDDEMKQAMPPRQAVAPQVKPAAPNEGFSPLKSIMGMFGGGAPPAPTGAAVVNDDESAASPAAPASGYDWRSKLKR